MFCANFQLTWIRLYYNLMTLITCLYIQMKKQCRICKNFVRTLYIYYICIFFATVNAPNPVRVVISIHCCVKPDVSLFLKKSVNFKHSNYNSNHCTVYKLANASDIEMCSEVNAAFMDLCLRFDRFKNCMTPLLSHILTSQLSPFNECMSPSCFMLVHFSSSSLIIIPICCELSSSSPLLLHNHVYSHQF